MVGQRGLGRKKVGAIIGALSGILPRRSDATGAGRVVRAFDDRASARFHVLRVLLLQALEPGQRVLAIEGRQLRVDLGEGFLQ